MRLVLRKNAHRTVDGDLEIASSPDTPGREQWQWHVRVRPFSAQPLEPNTKGTTLERADGTSSLVAATADPARVLTEVTALDLTKSCTVERHDGEVTVLVVGAGSVLVEGRHQLTELDVMVLAGDDPLAVDVAAAADSTSAALVRLRSMHGALAWVP